MTVTSKMLFEIMPKAVSMHLTFIDEIHLLYLYPGSTFFTDLEIVVGYIFWMWWVEKSENYE